MSLAGKLPVGTDVLINTKDKFVNKKGIVRYVGTLDGVQGQLIGVQIDTPDGVHSGQHKGKQYFKCKNLHGMFLKAKSISLTDGTPVAKLITGQATISPPKKMEKKQTKTTTKVQTKVTKVETKPTPKVDSKVVPQQKAVPKVTKTESKLQKPQSKKSLTNQLQSVDAQQFKSQYIMDNREQSQVIAQNLELKQRLEKIQEQMQAMKTQNQRAKYAVDANKQDKLKDLNQQLKFFKDQKQSFEKQKKRLNQKIKLLEAQLQQTAGNSELLEILTIKLQNCQGKNETLKQQLQQSKTQLRNAKSTLNTQMNQGSASKDLAEQVAILNQTITLLESDLKTTQQKLQQLTKQADSNKQKITDFNKLEKKLKVKQSQIQELKETVDQYETAANFAEAQTLKIIRKQQQLTQANKQLTEYVNKVEKMETEIRQNKDMLAEYDSMVVLFEQDIQKLNKTIKDKDVQSSELAAQLQRYKQKITQLVKSNQQMVTQKQIFDDLNKEQSIIPQFSRSDRYESKYKELQKHYQNISSQYISNQISFCQVKNQVGVQMLNLMDSLPQYFTGKFYPQVITSLVLLKTTNDKLYLLFDLTSQYLKQRHQVFAKDNIELAAWMIILLDKISILHSSLHRIELAIITSDSQQQVGQIVGQRALKEQIRRIDSFASQLLQRYATEDISPSIAIEPFTQPSESLDKINFQIHKKFSNQYETKMKLSSQTMKTIQRTFDKIIDYKMGSDLQQNAQLDVNIENLLRILLNYLKQCCLNPHLRLRSTMNKYLSGLQFIISIYNQIDENESVREFGNLYSETQQIKMLKDTIITTQVYTKQLLDDLKDIQYSNNLSKIHSKLPGTIWTERIKLIKDQLLRVKELSVQKAEMEASLVQAKKKIAILEKDIKDKQTVKQLHEKRIGELQLKVQQSISLENENKRQQQKLKAFQETNKDLAQELEKTNQRKKDAQEEVRKLKEKNDILQTEKMMQNKKSKLNANISSQDVASLAIFKNVIKENNELKNMDTKKKVWDLKHSLLLKSEKINKNVQSRQNNTTKAETQSIRRRALESMCKLKIFDPRAQSDPNSGLIENLFVELNLGQFKKNKEKESNKQIKVGKILLRGQLQNSKISISENRSLLESF